MKIIGSLEVIQLSEEEKKRFCVHLNKPNIDDLRNIKNNCRQDVKLGLYNIYEDYHFEKIGEWNVQRKRLCLHMERKGKW